MGGVTSPASDATVPAAEPVAQVTDTPVAPPVSGPAPAPEVPTTPEPAPAPAESVVPTTDSLTEPAVGGTDKSTDKSVV